MESIEFENDCFPKEANHLENQFMDTQKSALSSCDQESLQIQRNIRRGIRLFDDSSKGGKKNSQSELESAGNVRMKSQKRKKRFIKKLQVPLLRPVGSEVPQAPNNSTQFIMDNHENSSLFVDFNDGSEAKVKEADGSSPFQPADWFPYNVADFNYAYRSAKEDKLMNVSHVEIKNAILTMEAKFALLSDHLSASPSRLLANLQSQLLNLQEENSHLNIQAEKLRKERCLCKSSSSTTTSSSSTSSSSDSSSDSDDSSGSSSSDSSDNDCSPRQQFHKEENENSLSLNEPHPDSSFS